MQANSNFRFFVSNRFDLAVTAKDTSPMSFNESEATLKTEIHEAFARIREVIASCAIKSGRNPDEVNLIAVGKTKPDEAILAAYDCNQRAFAENKMQDLQARMARMQQPGLEWHMIGTLQSNKIRLIGDRVHWIHSAAKLSHLEEISRQAVKANRIINTLVQVNISAEDQKSGCEPAELPEILERGSVLPGICLAGLMGMASFSDQESVVRPQFARLRQLLEDSGKWVAHKADFQHLSMGMTHDFPWAIAEGATMVRIGSALFGER